MSSARSLTVTLTGEGPSDAWLLTPIRWLVARATAGRDLDLRSHFCTRDDRGADVASRIAFARTKYPSDICFVHRDADTVGLDARRAEIRAADRDPRVVPCVPVVANETWLLVDETAIRRAAGNPSGRASLSLPRRRDLERVKNPKEQLEQAMKVASGLGRNRLRGFVRDRGSWHELIAAHVESFEPHLELRGFEVFAEEATTAIETWIAERI